MASSSSTTSPEPRRRVRTRRPYRRRLYRRLPYQNYMRLIREFFGDEDLFVKNFGVTQKQFQTLNAVLSRRLNTNMVQFREVRSIRGRDRLALCLRFMATGRPYKEINEMYNLRPGVIDVIVREVSLAITEELCPVVMPQPTEGLWLEIARSFKNIHDMPNCIGSLNGKYINLMNQRLFSLLALVDAQHRYVMIDLYAYDASPVTIWNNSVMGRRFKANTYNVPSPRVPDSENQSDPDGRIMPFVMVAGPPFPITPHLITKFKDHECEGDDLKTVYNSRIASVKKTADDALTRLRLRWNLIQGTFPVPPPIAKRIILAICCLENFFAGPAPVPDRTVDANVSPSRISEVQSQVPRFESNTRDGFINYFLSPEGSVPWQYNKLV